MPVATRPRRARRCPTCQEVAYMEDLACPRCSRSFRQRCPHCGAQAPIWGNFCPNCSLSLSVPPAPPAVAQARPAIGSAPPPAWGNSSPMPAVRPVDYSTTPAARPVDYSTVPVPTPPPITPPSLPTPQAAALANLPTQISIPPHDLAIRDAPTVMMTPADPPHSASSEAEEPEISIPGLPSDADPESTLTPTEAKARKKSSNKGTRNKKQ